MWATPGYVYVDCAVCSSLIESMLVVDSQRRASLEEVAGHEWLSQEKEGSGSETVLPVISNVDEIPQQELEVILRRMEQGGYGSLEAILRYVGSPQALYF